MNLKFHSLQKRRLRLQKMQDTSLYHFLPHLKIENAKVFVTNKSKILKMASDPVDTRKKRTKSVKMFKKARILSKQSNAQTFLTSSSNLPNSVPLVSKFVKKQKQFSKFNELPSRRNHFMENQEIVSEIFDVREKIKKNSIVHVYSIKIKGIKQQNEGGNNSLTRLILEKQFSSDSQIQQNKQNHSNSSEDSFLKELIKQIK